MNVEKIKKLATDFSMQAEYVDICERLGYEGRIGEAKEHETASYHRLVDGIKESGLPLDEVLKQVHVSFPIEVVLKNGHGRWEIIFSCNPNRRKER